MAVNPVAYAENDLGVHAVFTEAQDRLERHNAASETIVDCNAELRKLKERLADREAEVVAEHRAVQHELSATAWKDHLKVVLAGDAETATIRGEVARVEGERESAQSDERHHTLGLAMLTARMSELAGLLNFYAEAKRATHS